MDQASKGGELEGGIPGERVHNSPGFAGWGPGPHGSLWNPGCVVGIMEHAQLGLKKGVRREHMGGSPGILGWGWGLSSLPLPPATLGLSLCFSLHVCFGFFSRQSSFSLLFLSLIEEDAHTDSPTTAPKFTYHVKCLAQTSWRLSRFHLSRRDPPHLGHGSPLTPVQSGKGLWV